MIVFIIGATCSGKTFMRTQVFTECDYIDVFDYQQDKSISSIIEAEKKFTHDFESKIASKEESTILVIEHPLSTHHRRKKLTDIIRKYTDEEIICMYMCPNASDVEFLVKKRFPDFDEKQKNYMLEDINYWNEFKDEPSKEDGFDKILKVVPVIS